MVRLNELRFHDATIVPRAIAATRGCGKDTWTNETTYPFPDKQNVRVTLPLFSRAFFYRPCLSDDELRYTGRLPRYPNCDMTSVRDEGDRLMIR